MIARPAITFRAYYSNQPEDYDGNKNTKAFTDALDDKSKERRIKNLTEEINTVFLAADTEGKIQILHSPKNFGGTRLRPKNKVIALVGLGTRATAVQLDDKHAVAMVSLRCPNLNLVDAETTAEGIKSIPIPDEDAVITCDATNIFLPAPWLKNAIMDEETSCPFEIIISIRRPIEDFIQNHCEGDQDLKDEIKAHHDAFVSWAWAVGHKKIEALKMLVSVRKGT